MLLEERKLEEKMTMEIIFSWKISNYWIHQIGQITTSELLLVHFDVNTPWLPSHINMKPRAVAGDFRYFQLSATW